MRLILHKIVVSLLFSLDRSTLPHPVPSNRDWKSLRRYHAKKEKRRRKKRKKQNEKKLFRFGIYGTLRDCLPGLSSFLRWCETHSVVPPVNSRSVSSTRIKASNASPFAPRVRTQPDQRSENEILKIQFLLYNVRLWPKKLASNSFGAGLRFWSKCLQRNEKGTTR